MRASPSALPPDLLLLLQPSRCFHPRSQLARWTFKRSLLKCLEAAVLTTSEHRKEILANDGVGVIVRSCRWRPLDADFKPKQEVSGR